MIMILSWLLFVWWMLCRMLSLWIDMIGIFGLGMVLSMFYVWVSNGLLWCVVGVGVVVWVDIVGFCGVGWLLVCVGMLVCEVLYFGE